MNVPANPATVVNPATKKTNWTLILALILLFLAVFFVQNRRANANLAYEMAMANEAKASLEEAKNAAEDAKKQKEEENEELNQTIAGLNAKILQLEEDTSQVGNLEKISELEAAVDSLGEKLDSIQRLNPSKEVAALKVKNAELEAKVASLEENASKGLVSKGGSPKAPKVEPLQTEPKIVETDMVGQPKKGEIWVSRTNQTVQVRKSMKDKVPAEFAAFTTKEWPR